jgi:hypothetical protein
MSAISSLSFGGRGPMQRLSSPSWGGPLSDKGSPGEILVRKATSLNRKRGRVVGLPNEQTSTRSDLGHQSGRWFALNPSRRHLINGICSEGKRAERAMIHH